MQFISLKANKAFVQLLSKSFRDSDFCHNNLHTLYLFAFLLGTYALFDD